MSEEKKTCKILAIESSCDETAAAVIEDGRTVYALCGDTLEPADEPACVLLEDWNRLRKGA